MGIRRQLSVLKHTPETSTIIPVLRNSAQSSVDDYKCNCADSNYLIKEHLLQII